MVFKFVDLFVSVFFFKKLLEFFSEVYDCYFKLYVLWFI